MDMMSSLRASVRRVWFDDDDLMTIVFTFEHEITKEVKERIIEAGWSPPNSQIHSFIHHSNQFILYCWVFHFTVQQSVIRSVF